MKNQLVIVFMMFSINMMAQENVDKDSLKL